MSDTEEKLRVCPACNSIMDWITGSIIACPNEDCLFIWNVGKKSIQPQFKLWAEMARQEYLLKMRERECNENRNSHSTVQATYEQPNERNEPMAKGEGH